MGQAKQRGSFEERREAVLKQQRIEQLRRDIQQADDDARADKLPPNRRQSSVMGLLAMTAMMAASLGSSKFRP
jgi:hypothetical protein